MSKNRMSVPPRGGTRTPPPVIHGDSSGDNMPQVFGLGNPTAKVSSVFLSTSARGVAAIGVGSEGWGSGAGALFRDGCGSLRGFGPPTCSALGTPLGVWDCGYVVAAGISSAFVPALAALGEQGQDDRGAAGEEADGAGEDEGPECAGHAIAIGALAHHVVDGHDGHDLDGGAEEEARGDAGEGGLAAGTAREGEEERRGDAPCHQAYDADSAEQDEVAGVTRRTGAADLIRDLVAQVLQVIGAKE